MMKVYDFEFKMEKALDDWLEDNTLEDFFEMLDIIPYDVLMHCYLTGFLTEEDFQFLTPTDIKD